MHINIKTYDEFHQSRVSVEVPDGQKFDIELDGEYRITNRKQDDTSVSDDGLSSNAEVQRDILRSKLERRTQERDERESARAALEADLQRVHELAGNEPLVALTRDHLTQRLLDIRRVFQA